MSHPFDGTRNRLMELKNIIVIGASAGGIQAVNKLISKLPQGLPVAMFVVIHMSKKSYPQVISDQLQKKTTYQCSIAEEGIKIQAGHIYVAPADLHMLVQDGTIRLTKGPHENRWRPSIDVLFRSAAVNYNSRVIGVILSGMLDDGVSGMGAIKRCGGLCIVQEPAEAEFADMPVNIINTVDVDHRVLIDDMGYIIADVLAQQSKPEAAVPEEIRIEAEITERMVSKITDMEKIAVHSNFTCPDCGGGLWKMKDDVLPRYRCHTGHVYNESLLLERQNEAMEESLWISIRMLEERRNLLLNMAWRESDSGNTHLTADYKRRAEDLNGHIERLKSLLITINKNESSDEGYL